MKRIPIVVPAVTACLVCLGGLMYAGNKGYNCVGAYDSRPVAHAPIDWRWYAALSAIALAASFIPMVIGLRRGRAA